MISDNQNLVPDEDNMPCIVVLPTEIQLTDDEKDEVFLSVEPAGEIQWNISNKPDWINVEPSSGTINTQKVALKVIPDIANLAVGSYSGNIEISSNGAGTAMFSVDLVVQPHPVAQLTPDTVKFSASEKQKTITILNVGRGLLNWEFDSKPDWLTFNVDKGIIVEGGKREIVAIVDRKGLDTGSRNAKAVLVSNSENGNEVLDVTIEIPADATLGVLTETLEFKYFENSKTFVIRNDGNVATDWKIMNTTDYMTIQPLTGFLEKGESIEVTINLNMAGNPTNVYNNTLLIENDADQTVPLYLTKNYYNDEKWFIEGAVVDAEYDRVNDVMVIAVINPDELIKFKTSDKTFETVPLDYSPQNVSISPDGTHAASGHNGYFSYVDLNSMEVEKVFPVSINIFDIIIASNGWVYATPVTGEWTDFSNIELSTGIETKSSAMLLRSGTKIKLHPSGNFIYGCKTDTSPTDFEKYDITSGTLKYLYDSKYHGDYNFGKNISGYPITAIFFWEKAELFLIHLQKKQQILYTILNWKEQEMSFFSITALLQTGCMRFFPQILHGMKFQTMR